MVLFVFPVTFNDDDPRRGFCTVFLSVPELSVNRRLFSKNTPKNGQVLPKFTAA